MYIIMIDEEACGGCGECVDTCPVSLFSLTGEDKVELTGDAAECMGCESCVAICEKAAITLQEV